MQYDTRSCVLCHWPWRLRVVRVHRRVPDDHAGDQRDPHSTQHRDGGLEGRAEINHTFMRLLKTTTFQAHENLPIKA